LEEWKGEGTGGVYFTAHSIHLDGLKETTRNTHLAQLVSESKAEVATSKSQHSVSATVRLFD
jgi:hypothetical protein